MRSIFENFAESYLPATSEKLKDHSFASFARHDVVKLVQENIGRPDLKVTCSVGQGNWAEIPWIGIFNPEMTTSATNGIYLVYLFNTDLNAVYLCQGQGVTLVKEEFGKAAVGELKRRASLIRSRVPEYATFFDETNIYLGGRSPLAKSYDPAVAYSKRYDLNNIPQDEVLIADLNNAIELYDLLVSRGGTDNLETFNSFVENDEALEIEEKRQYVRHSRIERNTSAAQKVKALLGCTCMGCGLDFQRIYGERGKGFIEAHHLKPLHLLPVGQAVPMDPRADFAVLCSNCHRMVHRHKPMLTIEELRSLKGVKMLRNAFEARKQ